MRDRNQSDLTSAGLRTFLCGQHFLFFLAKCQYRQLIACLLRHLIVGVLLAGKRRRTDEGRWAISSRHTGVQSAEKKDSSSRAGQKGSNRSFVESTELCPLEQIRANEYSDAHGWGEVNTRYDGGFVCGPISHPRRRMPTTIAPSTSALPLSYTPSLLKCGAKTNLVSPRYRASNG